jgi:hypothetical protein
MADQISSASAALERVLDFVRTLQAGGGGEAIRPFRAADFRLFEAPHLLAPEGPPARWNRCLQALTKAAKW